MEALSERKSRIAKRLDKEIKELEEELEEVQPLIDELAQLKRTRATLLSERSVTGGINKGTRLTMEEVITALRANDNDPMTPQEIATELGVDPTVVRSHLNRHSDVRYRKNGDGKWHLIGEDTEEE
jgi:response regulator of citrate/malate metabolism